MVGKGGQQFPLSKAYLVMVNTLLEDVTGLQATVMRIHTANQKITQLMAGAKLKMEKLQSSRDPDVSQKMLTLFLKNWGTPPNKSWRWVTTPSFSKPCSIN